MLIDNRVSAVLRVLRGESPETVAEAYASENWTSAEVSNDVRSFLSGGREALRAAPLPMTMSEAIEDIHAAIGDLSRRAQRLERLAFPRPPESWGNPDSL